MGLRTFLTHFLYKMSGLQSEPKRPGGLNPEDPGFKEACLMNRRWASSLNSPGFVSMTIPVVVCPPVSVPLSPPPCGMRMRGTPSWGAFSELLNNSVQNVVGRGAQPCGSGASVFPTLRGAWAWHTNRGPGPPRPDRAPSRGEEKMGSNEHSGCAIRTLQ